MTVTKILDRIDWNFPRAGTETESVHSTHWFPGNFIPQIPRSFIEVLSNPGDLVFDPFAGSGTTGLAAAALGRRAILSDRISACIFLTRAKHDIQSIGLSQRKLSDILAKLTWRHQCVSDIFGLNGEGSDPDLSHWFAPLTLSQLRFLWGVIEREPDAIARRILTLLFSDVLFACASPGRALTSTGKRRRHHWGWVADNVHPKPPIEHDAIELFEARLVMLPRPLPLESLGEALSVQQDARRLALSTSCTDLVVTSPPYLGVIDYTRANRLLYTWMGWSFDMERKEEIGARYKRQRQNVVEKYLEEMRICWSEISRVLRPGGYCAIIIGESRRFPGTVDQTVNDLSGLLSKVWGPVTRVASRRRVSDRGANETIELLYVFRKQ